MKANNIHDVDIDTASNGLAFCPFCGCMARIVANWNNVIGYHHFGVMCDSCLSQTPMAFDTPEAAAEFWNNRKDGPAETLKKTKRGEKRGEDDEDQESLFDDEEA